MPRDEKNVVLIKPERVKVILIVEKDAGVGSFLELATAAETPYQTVFVTDPSQAIEVTQSLKPDLFLIDYHLPNLDGIQLYDRLHAIEALEAVPAIIMSTDFPRLEHEIKKRSLVGISKPFELDKFLDLITKLIDQPI